MRVAPFYLPLTYYHLIMCLKMRTFVHFFCSALRMLNPIVTESFFSDGRRRAKNLQCKAGLLEPIPHCN